MEMASTSASLNSYGVLSVLQRSSVSRIHSLSLFPLRTSYPSSLCSVSTSKVKPVSFLPLRTGRLQQSAVCNSTTVRNDSVEKINPANEQSDPVATDEATERNYVNDRNGSSEHVDEHKMIRVCDKLIQVFLVDKPTPTDWRRLLIFSKTWDDIRPHFYERCQDRAENEGDPGMKHSLLRLARKLKEVDEDVQKHNELLKVIRESPNEINEIVAKRRKDFTKEFFIHVYTVAASYFNNQAEQDAVSKLANVCLDAVQTYDTQRDNIEAISAAQLKLEDILKSPSLDAACKKIDDLAAKNQLDSTLVLMITKAWSAAKETDMTKDEAKDILYHLYVTALGNLQRNMPKEIRIVKYLLRIEDPEERMSALQDAFTPGAEIEGKDVDCLYTTPEKLHTWIRAVVDAYHFSGEGTLLRQARDLMNPEMIQRLEELKKLVEAKFM